MTTKQLGKSNSTTCYPHFIKLTVTGKILTLLLPLIPGDKESKIPILNIDILLFFNEFFNFFYYGIECRSIKKHMLKMSVANMKMLLRWMYVKTKKDKIRNKHFGQQLGKASIGDKRRETRLR